MSYRKILLGLLMASVSASVLAFSHLVVNKDTSTEKTFSFKNLQKINFVEGGIEFVNGEDVTIPFSEISTIHFVSGAMDSNRDIPSEDLTVKLDPAHMTVHIHGSVTSATLEIYSLSGIQIKSIMVSDGEVVDISNLVAGTYVVKLGDKIFKFVK